MEGMRFIGNLNADLSALAAGLPIKNGPRGMRFYRVDYDVCVYSGGTRLLAGLQWREGVSIFASRNSSLLIKSQGVLREGPVTVIPYVF